MKLGEYKKINEYCGIARVSHFDKSKNSYAVYVNVMTSDMHIGDNFYGYTISEGQTEDEALTKAIDFLVKREYVYENKLAEKLTELEKEFHKHMFTNADHNGIKILTNEFDNPSDYTEVENAVIVINEKNNKANIGIQ